MATAKWRACDVKWWALKITVRRSFLATADETKPRLCQDDTARGSLVGFDQTARRFPGVNVDGCSRGWCGVTWNSYVGFVREDALQFQSIPAIGPSDFQLACAGIGE